MKSRGMVVALLVVAAALAFWWWRSGMTETPMPSQYESSQAAAISNALAHQDPKTVALIASNFAQVQPVPENPAAATAVASVPAGAPSPLQFTNFDAPIVLENMRRGIRQYSDVFGGNPTGTNPEITGQLHGGNPRHIDFINEENGMRIVGGQLVDPWGTPYFFHQLSAKEMEIHSAGPDRVMWNSDDLVTQ